MSFKRLMAVVISLLVTIVALSAAVAVARDDRPHTDAVTGGFRASPVDVKQRICAGRDGTYLELRGEWAGNVVSADPRVAGDLRFRATPALVNVITGLGTFRGDFTITDPVTGKKKAEGDFHTVVTEGRLNHGFALGTVRKAGGLPGGDFFANLKSTIDPVTLHVGGEFGLAGDARTPAVIQGGRCSSEDGDDHDDE